MTKSPFATKNHDLPKTGIPRVEFIERWYKSRALALTADVVGYSKLMGNEEVGTLERLKRCRRELFDPAVAEFRGRIIKLMGDGALVEFARVVEAVQCSSDSTEHGEA